MPIGASKKLVASTREPGTCFAPSARSDEALVTASTLPSRSIW
jgi:hypothetical protein